MNTNLKPMDAGWWRFQKSLDYGTTANEAMAKAETLALRACAEMDSKLSITSEILGDHCVSKKMQPERVCNPFRNV